MVLTVETWLVFSGSLHDHVLARARAKAAQDPDILPEDQRRVVLVAIQDFERVLSTTDERGLLHTLSTATEEQFSGWLLPNVQGKLEQSKSEQKPYPFDVGDILPWWREFQLQRTSAIS